MKTFRKLGRKPIVTNFKYNESASSIRAHEVGMNIPSKALRAFSTEYEEKVDSYVEFALKEDSKILSIESLTDLRNAYDVYGKTTIGSRRVIRGIDWNKLRQDYDAIYFNIPDMTEEDIRFYNTKYWCCKSIYILNLEKIVVH